MTKPRILNLNPKISASILSADFTRLGEEVSEVTKAGADMLHIDIMDNHYVPNLTYGPIIPHALRKAGFNQAFDVHLMVEPVDELIKKFLKIGTQMLCFHPEASKHVDRSLQLIRDGGCKAGLAFNPATPLIWLNHLIDKLDFILIMSVNPGFSDQKFIPESLNKIKQAYSLVQRHNHAIEIAVDGGIKLENIAEIAQAGANIFVVGSGIFGQKTYQQTIQGMKKILKDVNNEKK